VAVAGFPQGHPETSDTAEGLHQEMIWLKEKVDAGADFIFTQMFYDTDIFFDWVRRVRAAGITVPIVPGIMPIQNWEKFQTWVKREKIVVPPHFYDALLPFKGDDEKVRQIGTKLVGEMCRQILDDEEAGIKGLHIYTLNLEKGARMLLRELGLEGRREQIAPLPWRRSLTPHRRSESIRPIFWYAPLPDIGEVVQADHSGRTALSLTSRVRMTGTNSRTADGVTPARRRTVISTVTPCPSVLV
jgi:methylenetetrahydrofolate reductase (NADPH)